MNIPSPRQVAQALAQYEPMDIPALPGRTNHLRSAVLIPLVWRDDIEVVLTVRSGSLRLHAGEVCFPGGRPNTPDESDVDTAKREAQEELGIVNPAVLGRLSRMPVFTSDHRMAAVVAHIADTVLRPNPDEVAEVLYLPVGEHLSRPAIEALPWQFEGVDSDSPVFHLGPHLLYGATAHVFVELLEVLAPLYGTERPPFARGHTRWADILPPGFSVPAPDDLLV
jgi:8-oxo-dGTP pyrophosphatase MutT (NUDIX family)